MEHLREEDASGAAALGLHALMSGLSEEFWCATWLTGLEHSLWQAREGGSPRFGLGELTERQVALLRLLSEECDGWWHWPAGAAEPEFVRLDKWRAALPSRGTVG